MKLEIALLGVLAAHPMTGYEIKKWLAVEGQFNGLDRHSSQIYRQLVRMETAGWLEHRVHERRGGADAKLYSVTDAGMERLTRWVYSAYRPYALMANPEFDYRLRFSAMIDRRRCIEILRQELDFREEQVRKNRTRDRAMPAENHRAEVDLDALQVIEDSEHFHGSEMVDHKIRWLRDRIEQLVEQGWDR